MDLPTPVPSTPLFSHVSAPMDKPTGTAGILESRLEPAPVCMTAGMTYTPQPSDQPAATSLAAPRASNNLTYRE